MTQPEIENRLDRIEAILERNAQQLQETRQIADSNARAIAANSNDIQQLRLTAQQTVTDIAQWFTGVITNMEEMQSEVRGLQVENRRILERLESREQQ